MPEAAAEKITYDVIEIASIRRDATQTRAALNSERVSQYAERAQAGESFPAPVVFFDGETYWLAAGHHRIEAFIRCAFSGVECDVRKGGRADAVLFGAQDNVQHDRAGLHRSNADKRRAVEMVFAALGEMGEDWSAKRISQWCGVSEALVGDVRQALKQMTLASRDPVADGNRPTDEKPPRKLQPTDEARATALESLDRFLEAYVETWEGSDRRVLVERLKAWVKKLEAA